MSGLGILLIGGGCGTAPAAAVVPAVLFVGGGGLELGVLLSTSGLEPAVVSLLLGSFALRIAAALLGLALAVGCLTAVFVGVLVGACTLLDVVETGVLVGTAAVLTVVTTGGGDGLGTLLVTFCTEGDGVLLLAVGGGGGLLIGLAVGVTFCLVAED